MKKRIFALVLALAMLAGLAACTPAQTTTTTTTKPTTAAPTTTATTTAPTTTAPTTTVNPITGKIKVFSRDATSGTREAFESVVGFAGKLTNEAFEVASNGDMAAKVGAEKMGIGYVSLTTDFAANKLNPVNYEGVEPTIKTVVDGTYKLKRPFSYATRAAGDFDSADKEALVAAFIDYIENSVEGREVVLGAGGIVDVDSGKAWSELKKNHPIVDKDNSGMTLYTGGSTSVEKTLKAALESFVPMAGGFKINMNHTGSGDGHKRVLGSEKDGANKADIGFASRDFKTEENVSGAKLAGVYCQDAVVVVVNIENTQLTNLTKDQVAATFKGEISEWDALLK